MSFFDKNLSVLRVVNPPLYQKIITSRASSEDVEIIPAKNGSFSARVKTTSGGAHLLHSRYAPEREAKVLIDSAFASAMDCYIVYGFGLGYHVKELLNRLHRTSAVYVVEKNLQLFKRALELFDFSKYLANPKLTILVDPAKAELFAELQKNMIQIFLGAKTIIHPASVNAYPHFYKTMSSYVHDFFDYGHRNIISLFLLNFATRNNLLNNLPYYAFCRGVNILESRFKGYPAIVVSAGPSLAKNIDLLKDLKGKAVIIAVATIYKTLIKKGIIPDFVCCLDFHQVSRFYFDGMEGSADVPLIADPKLSWHVLESHSGRKFLSRNDYLDRILDPITVNKSTLRAGATVAHLAFYFAELIGADPIIFVGQDLSHSHGITHIPGTPTHDVWRVELNRFNTLEMKEWETILRMRGILKKVQDIYGNEIYTDDQMFNYEQQFEKDFFQSKSRVIDATEGGTRKENTEIMTLRQAMDAFCSRNIPSEMYDYSQDASDSFKTKVDLPELLRVIEEKQGATLQVERLFKKTIRVLKKVEKNLDDPARANELIAKAHRYRDQAHSEFAEIYSIVAEIGQAEELVKLQRDRSILAEDLTGVKKARRQLERDIAYIESLVKSAQTFKKLLDIGKERLQNFDFGKIE